MGEEHTNIPLVLFYVSRVTVALLEYAYAYSASNLCTLLRNQPFLYSSLVVLFFSVFNPE
jgi:hypothetical protein